MTVECGVRNVEKSVEKVKNPINTRDMPLWKTMWKKWKTIPDMRLICAYRYIPNCIHCATYTENLMYFPLDNHQTAFHRKWGQILIFFKLHTVIFRYPPFPLFLKWGQISTAKRRIFKSRLFVWFFSRVNFLTPYFLTNWKCQLSFPTNLYSDN